MKSILTIQHIDCEPLGRFYPEAGDAAGFEYVRPYAQEAVPDSLEGWDGLIVLGGPIAVYEVADNPFLRDELELIRKAIAADIPTLGVCLGAQLIAAAAGARVYAGSRREVGWSTVSLTGDASADPLFSGLPSPLGVFQLHGDTFDLPSGAVLLAGNEVYPNQAFRLGRKVYGLQFHVEAEEDMIREWSGFYADYMTEAGVEPGDIVSATDEMIPAQRQAAARIISGFLSLGDS